MNVIIKKITMLIVVGIVIMFVYGIRPVVIISGSMEPDIKTGSVAFLNTKAKFEEMKKGDIVAFELGNHLTIHRIIEITEEGFETKGDANRVSDGITTTKTNLKGKVVFDIPKIGFLIAKVKTIQGMVTMLSIIIASMLLKQIKASKMISMVFIILIIVCAQETTVSASGNLLNYKIIRDGTNENNIWIFAKIEGNQKIPTIWSGPEGEVLQGTMENCNVTYDGIIYNFRYRIPIKKGNYGLYCFHIMIDGVGTGRVDFIAGNCKVGNTFYNTIADAASQAPDNSVIEILREDCREYETIEIMNGKTMSIYPFANEKIIVDGHEVKLREEQENITIYQPNNFNWPHLIRAIGSNLTIGGTDGCQLNLDGKNLDAGLNDSYGQVPVVLYAYIRENDADSYVKIKSGVNIYGASNEYGGEGVDCYKGSGIQGNIILEIEDGVNIHDCKTFGVSSADILIVRGGNYYNNGSIGILSYANGANASCTIEGGKIYQNGTSGVALGNTITYGGNQHQANISNAEIFGNYKDGIYVNTSGGEIWDAAFQKNEIYQNGRSGIYLNKGGKFVYLNGSSYQNEASGITVMEAELCVKEGRIFENRNSGIHNEGKTTLSGKVRIEQNNSPDKGGGIYNNGVMYIEDGIISNNQADKGGGIYSEKAILNLEKAFAIYSETDKSLRFYNREVTQLKKGDIFEGRIVTDIFPEIEELEGTTSAGEIPWHASYITLIEKVVVEDTIQPVNTSLWFEHAVNCSYMDLEKLDMSKVKDAHWMFAYAGYNKETFLIKGVENWNTKALVNVERMFIFAGDNADYILDLRKWDVSCVTNHQNFSYSVEDKILLPTFRETKSNLRYQQNTLKQTDTEEQSIEKVSGYLYISGGEISKNNAITNGGGIYNTGVMRQTGGEIQGNTTEMSKGYGTAIFQDGEMYMSEEASVNINNVVQLGTSNLITVDGELQQAGTLAVVCPYYRYEIYGTPCIRGAYGDVKASELLQKFELYALNDYPYDIFRPGDLINEGTGVLDTDIILSRKYPVCYDANGGENPPLPQNKYWNEEMYLTKDIPLKEGYSFLHWNTQTDDMGLIYHPGDSYNINEELKLFAQWEIEKKEVHVTCEIFSEDYLKEHGDAIFLIKVSGKDLNDKEHTYYQAVVMDEHYVQKFTDNSGKVEREIVFENIPAGTYTISAMETGRWSLKKVINISNSEVTQQTANVNLKKHNSASTLFEFGKYEWQGFSDLDLLENILVM